MRIFLLIGLFLFFVDDFLALFKKLPKIDLLTKFDNFSFRRKKKTLHEQVNELKKGKKENFLQKSYNTMKLTLIKTGQLHNLKRYKLMCLFCGIIAFFASLYFRAYMLSPIALIGCTLIPMWYVRFKDYRYRLLLNAELTVTLSSITNSYKRSENLVKSINDNLKHMKYPIKVHFETFCTNIKYVDSNIEMNLDVLQKQINNKIFKLWCDNIKMCSKDINHKDSLDAIINQLDIERKIQDDIKLIISKPINMMMVLMLMSLCVFPVLYLFEPLLIDILFSTIIGQSMVVGLFLCILITTDKAVTLSTKPAE